MNPATRVNTKTVMGRRDVCYESFGDVLADAERLAVLPTVTLGNWSVGQIYKHLAMATDVMLDGAPSTPPLPIQWILRLLLKKRMTTKTLPPGYQLRNKAAVLIPSDTPIDDGLALLRTATRRIESSSERGVHPVFGRCTREDWDAFHFRHCELHMSYIVCTEQNCG